MPDIQPPSVENSIPRPASREQNIIPTGLNSINEGKRSFIGFSIIAYGALISVLVMALGVGLFLLSKSNMQRSLESVISENNKLQNLLSTGTYKQAETDLANLKLEVENLKTVLISQRDFAGMFKIIGNNTYKKVKYNSFNFTKDGKITVVGSTETYSDLGKFLKSFGQTKEIKNFSIGTYSGGGEGKAAVNFSFSFEYPLVSINNFSKNSSTSGNSNATTNKTTSGTNSTSNPLNQGATQ